MAHSRAPMPWLFHIALAVHIGAGLVALTSFWGAIATAKGSAAHRRWGAVFTTSIYLVCAQALAMGTHSVLWPLAMHAGLRDAPLYRGLLGWMMIFLALLTMAMTRYGVMVAANRDAHARNQRWPILALLAAVALSAVNCLVHGIALGQPLMFVVALLGLAVVATYLRYLFAVPPDPRAYVREHLKAMIASGISAYTAFLSVGLIEWLPQHAFNPAIWAAPSVVGAALLVRNLRRFAPQAARTPRRDLSS